jgi:hypothetical protein
MAPEWREINTQQNKSVPAVLFFAGSNDIMMRRPGTPGYIGDTKAKKTTGSHHIMPIGQGDVDSCSNLHGEN